MNAENRREMIKEQLKAACGPISAMALADQLSVSRQVIVGDIALLRAAGTPVVATPRGYILSKPVGVCGQIVCCHSAQDMEEELYLLVDLGCVVEDVSVEHPVYGQLTGRLQLACRADVAAFLEKVKEHAAMPLSALTEGIHTHSLRCSNQETLEIAREALRQKHILQE